MTICRRWTQPCARRALTCGILDDDAGKAWRDQSSATHRKRPVAADESDDCGAGAMALREFRDRFGVQWSVCAVNPERTERRRHRPGSVYAGPERRTQRDAEWRAQVREGYERGWLVFDTRGERRRLAPIPEGWNDMGDELLEQLCARAVSAGPPRRLP